MVAKVRYEVNTLLHKLSVSVDGQGEPVFDPVEIQELATFFDLSRNALKMLRGPYSCWCEVRLGDSTVKEHSNGCKLAIAALQALHDED